MFYPPGYTRVDDEEDDDDGGAEASYDPIDPAGLIASRVRHATQKKVNEILSQRQAAHELAGGRWQNPHEADRSSHALELRAALILRAGLPKKIRELSDRTSALVFERAEMQFGQHGADLRTVARSILDLEGLPDPLHTGGRMLSAFSSGTGNAVLAGLVNQQFMRSYGPSPDTTTGWVVERPLQDFRANRRLRHMFGESVPILPRGGTASHITFDLAGAEVYSAVRYAATFVVDEQDLVSDDLDAVLTPFTVIGKKFAALKLDLIYSELLANSALADSVALFHATHANLETSAALTAATLDTAIKDMRVQTENSAALNVVPSYLLVPPALEGTAHRLVRDMTSADRAPLTVRSEPRLSLGVADPRLPGTTHAGSATTWYLASDDSTPTIEFGRRTPEAEISATPLSKGQWGVRFSACWDCGAKALDYRSMQKNSA